MPTYSADVLASTTGLNLGSSATRWNAFIQTLDVSGTVSLGSATATGALTGNTLVSTVATGTAPLTVTSTTKVSNLNADLLDGTDWTAPGTIGGTTPGAASFTTLSASGQITSTVATGTSPLVIASTTQVANLNVSSLVGATWISPGAIGSTTPSTGAFTTLSTTPVTGGAMTVGGAIAVSTSAVTASANSTNTQNLSSATIPAGLLNAAGKTLRVFMAGVYSTQAGQTPTVTIGLALGGVTMFVATSSATTASQTNLPWEAVAYVSTVTTGASGTLECHCIYSIRIGSGAGASEVHGDSNAAVSAAVDLTAAASLQCTTAFSTNTSPANSVTQRQLVVEVMN